MSKSISTKRKDVSVLSTSAWILNATEEVFILLDNQFEIVYFSESYKKFYNNFLNKRITKGGKYPYAIPGFESKEKAILERVLNGALVENEFNIHDPIRDQLLTYSINYRPAKDPGNNNPAGILISLKDRTLSIAIKVCFNHNTDLKTCLNKLLGVLGNHFNQLAGEIWMVDETEQHLQLEATYDPDKSLKGVNDQLVLSKGKGLTGLCWKNKTAIFIKDIRTNSFYERKVFAEKNNLSSATVIPVSHLTKTVAVLLFYNKKNGAAKPVVLSNAILTQIYFELEHRKSNKSLRAEKTTALETKRALQEKNEILNSIGDGFITLDNQWVITFWSKQAEKLTGKPNRNVVGSNLWEVFPEQVNTPFYRNCLKAKDSLETQYFETHDPVKNIWYEISAYPNANGLAISLRNITARVIQDNEIRQTNDRFELIAKATNVALWDYHIPTSKLTQIGNGYAKLFGFTFEKVIDGSSFLTNYVHPDDLPLLIDSRNKAIKDSNQINWSGEYRLVKNGSETIYVQEKIYIMRDHAGRATRLIGATQDITKQKLNELSLEKLNKELENYARNLAASNAELEQFAYVASHDLQEPLRMVNSFMMLLEKNYKDKLDDRARQYIHFAADGAQRMRKIIMDLLEYSRVTRFIKEKEEINLSTLVEEILLLFRKQIHDKEAVVTVHPLPILYSHRIPIHQVFQNLIGNALKYTKIGVAPSIHVSYLATETEYRFEVSDNGVGIDPQHFEKIFVIFQRLQSADQNEGTGMGLSVCKRIIETLGGKIWVESQEGKGSSFYFTLPKQAI
jgi:PAS domain S-box-containing protein